MNKTALKNFATNARRELLEKVELQARKIGITAEVIQKAEIESSDSIIIGGKQLTKEERIQRNKLIARINEIGFSRVMEEVAYTWFNRFTALRFMEVNDYLPTKVRVLSSSNSDSAEPDMMKEALSLDLDLDKELVYELKMKNNTEELFKYLIIKHCNDLNKYMPFMFEKIDDFTEILFPEGLLATNSLIEKMTNTEIIPEDNWEKVEIIGWLYQYYISEEKDKIFANLKKNIKITKDTLPAATQLFTPNWIVRYMVENSLGRIWLESYPNSSLKTGWKYYINEAEQEEEVINNLKEIRYKNVSPEEITFLDPCCGSGHILVYAFEIFYDMYLEKGYVESEIPKLIFEKNLFGIDVDNRAVQLASFAVMMKAREKSRRIFRQSINLNICAIQDSNWLTDEMIDNISKNDTNNKVNLKSIRNSFLNAKEYGSLLQVEAVSFETLEGCLQEYKEEQVNLIEMIDKQTIEEKLPLLLIQAKLLSESYDVVCTNPPYMGRTGMNAKLTDYLNKYYKDTKSDLFAAFIEKGFDLTKNEGFNSMVTMQSWMLLSSYEKMRENIINNKTIVSLLHMDNMVMGIAFGTSATVFRNAYVKRYKGYYTEIKYENISGKNIPTQFPVKENKNGVVPSEIFNKIPGSPIAYWVSESVSSIFGKEKVGDFGDSREGMATANNDYFLKNWFEVNVKKVGFGYNGRLEAQQSKLKWFPYNKGGTFRRWYGNNENVVNWFDDGCEIREFKDIKTGRVRSHNYNLDHIFQKSLTWTSISASLFSCRFSDSGKLFDTKGRSLFIKDESMFLYTLGYLNSKVAQEFLNITASTIDYKNGSIADLPLIKNENSLGKINELVNACIIASKNDWDSLETSWDFSQHPFMNYNENVPTIEQALIKWNAHIEKEFKQLKMNETELNRTFIELYNLQNDVTSEVDAKNITIRQPNLEKDIKSFVSYAIGCSFGRYSLDDKGLIYAGGEFDLSKYKKFVPTHENILPILSGAYFNDDIVIKFINFVSVTFGEESLTENIDFIVNAIGRKSGETANESLRRYFMNDFYKDHIQTYKKTPIYWLFTSGKEKAFNCLIYMHRYDKTTLSRIRTDYLHEVQIRMDAEKKDLLTIIEGDSTTIEISNAKKELKSLDKKIDELKAYDELLHHKADMQIEIDLDDGVAVNYEKFNGLVAKI